MTVIKKSTKIGYVTVDRAIYFLTKLYFVSLLGNLKRSRGFGFILLRLPVTFCGTWNMSQVPQFCKVLQINPLLCSLTNAKAF